MAHFRNVSVQKVTERFTSKSQMEVLTKNGGCMRFLIEVFGILLNETRLEIHSTRDIERALTFIIDV
jgi:hypothetical protein